MPLLALAPPASPNVALHDQQRAEEMEPSNDCIGSGPQRDAIQHPSRTAINDRPPDVIDSRLTLIARGNEPAKYTQSGEDWLYHWSVQASLGPVASELNHLVPTREARSEVKGELTLITPNRFRLSNITTVVPIEAGAPLTRLNEKATGDCHEQD